MACSVKVGYPGASFKSEYILPQLVLQWIKNHRDFKTKKIIGVKYSSTKIDEYNKFGGDLYNLAIPIHSSSATGFCNVLKEDFHLTKPISFHKALERSRNTINTHNQSQLILINGATVEYAATDFGKIEQLLEQDTDFRFYNVLGK